MQKRIGTALPLSALRSKTLRDETGGTFATALIFLLWLERTGQTIWQLLPLAQTHLEPGSRTKRVPSPYKGYGVGFDPAYLGSLWSDLVPSDKERRRFLKMHGAWLSDYALFCALTDAFGTDDWTTWAPDIRSHTKGAVTRWTAKLAKEIQHHIDVQWRLHAAFHDVRETATAAGIRLVGDMPFYLPLKSPLVWAWQACFDIERDGTLTRVSGVPNGPKAHFGRQVWGHPLYRWDTRKRRAGTLALWKIRLEHAARLYDWVRLDHAKGFYHFGAMDMKNAKRDKIMPGPGSPALEMLIRMARKLGLALYAEDAGDRLKELRASLKHHRIPGIRILRFAYNEKKQRLEPNYARVEKYPSNAFAYTSTHDTDTLIGYVRLLSVAEKRILAAAVGIPFSANAKTLATSLRNAAIHSRAKTVIIPLQDWILSDKRINVPGTERPVGDTNWRYRMPVPIETLPTKLF